MPGTANQRRSMMRMGGLKGYPPLPDGVIDSFDRAMIMDYYRPSSSPPPVTGGAYYRLMLRTRRRRNEK